MQMSYRSDWRRAFAPNDADLSFLLFRRHRNDRADTAIDEVAVLVDQKRLARMSGAGDIKWIALTR
jgi:hypothetical protein